MKRTNHSVESLFATQTTGDPLDFLLPDQQVMAPLVVAPPLGAARDHRKVQSLSLLNQHFQVTEIATLQVEDKNSVSIDPLVMEESNILKQLGINKNQSSPLSNLVAGDKKPSRCVSYKSSLADVKAEQGQEEVKRRTISTWSLKILWKKLRIAWF